MKGKGRLILGYIASTSGYALGVAVTVKRLLGGVSASELLREASAFFPSLRIQGLIIPFGLVLLSVSTGLSPVGIATSLPVGATSTYWWGVFSASLFAAFGTGGITRIAVALPAMISTFFIFTALSAEGIRASCFTIQRLGLIKERKSQYLDTGEGFSLGEYLRAVTFALLLSVAVTLYGQAVMGYMLQ